MLECPIPDHLTLCVETLETSKKLVPTLDRDVKVLHLSAGLQKFEFSPDFYRVTKEDLMSDQKRRWVRFTIGPFYLFYHLYLFLLLTVLRCVSFEVFFSVSSANC